MTPRFIESEVEIAALEWFSRLGYAVLSGPDIAPGEPAAERESYDQVVLVGRLEEAIGRLNPHVPEEAREEALRKVRRRIDDLAPGGGFVFAAVHNIQADVPPQNVEAMWEAMRECGAYGE